MVNRGGWIRIIEASLALLLILSVALIISTNRAPQKTYDLTGEMDSVLNEIAQNNSLRVKILNNESGVVLEIKSILDKELNTNMFGYSIRICEIEDLCALDSYPVGATENIYAAERVISAEPGIYGPKKLKIFVWTR